MGTGLIDLDPPWDTLTLGDNVDFQADMIIFDPLGFKQHMQDLLVKEVCGDFRPVTQPTEVQFPSGAGDKNESKVDSGRD